MRLRIEFELQREMLIPIDHQYALSGLVYRLLGASDAEYARFLHDEGYKPEPERAKRFKLFTFSSLRAPKSRRQQIGDRLRLAPGPVEWLLSSGLDDFLYHSASGLLSAGQTVCVGPHALTIREVAALPEPQFSRQMKFTCLSPIVASCALPDGRTHYMRPTEGEAISSAVRNNVMQKHRVLHGAPPEDDALTLTFDSGYLSDPKHRGTRKTRIGNGIDVVGAFAPFTLTGSPELIRTGYLCGLGEKNGMGFWMAEAR